MITLTMSQIILLHDQLCDITGGSKELRDTGLLQSALAAPFQSFYGRDAYPSLQQKAARLAFGLIKNHPFVDGNKRIGTHAMLVFLDINGIELKYKRSDLYELILSVASGSSGYDEILQWLVDHEK